MFYPDSNCKQHSRNCNQRHLPLQSPMLVVGLVVGLVVMLMMVLMMMFMFMLF